MKRAFVIPVWLNDFLAARNLPVSKVIEPGWLDSILSGPDVKSYEVAQQIMSLNTPLNLLAPLFNNRGTDDEMISALRWICPELLYGVDPSDKRATADVVFYRALVGGVSYETTPVTKEQAQLLDFDVEYHGDALFVIAKSASSSLLEPSIRAAVLDRAIAALRVFQPLEQVAVNEMFSRWLRETQLAKGIA